MKRRHVLLHAAGAISLTAGCSSTSDTPAGRTTVEPEIETLPETSPESSVDCDDGTLDILDEADRDSYSAQSNEFELQASTDTVAIGEEITFTLTNVGSEEQFIGEIYKYTIQHRENDEWTPIYYRPEPQWTDFAPRVAPDGGYEWPFTFDQEGLEREHSSSNTPYYVCSALKPGTYRFVFWGLENPLSKRFTVKEA